MMITEFDLDRIWDARHEAEQDELAASRLDYDDVHREFEASEWHDPYVESWFPRIVDGEWVVDVVMCDHTGQDFGRRIHWNENRILGERYTDVASIENDADWLV